jgi:hypothetical protein
LRAFRRLRSSFAILKAFKRWSVVKANIWIAAVAPLMMGANEPVRLPTATPSVGTVCTNPVWRSSTNGAMHSDDDFIVHNKMWNASGYRVSQTVEACSYRSWNVIVTADNGTGDGAVKTYPNVHKDYHDWSTGYEPPLSNYPTLSSAFAATGPNSGIHNIAYDIWLNGVGNGGASNREVMIWTDNQGQRPAGSVVATGLELGEQTWTLWATEDDHVLSFVPATDMASGTVKHPSHARLPHRPWPGSCQLDPWPDRLRGRDRFHQSGPCDLQLHGLLTDRPLTETWVGFFAGAWG